MIDHNNLEEFQDPVNYDLEEVPGSEERIAFYCQMAQEAGGPVLEIACGTGIVGLSIAAQGLALTGVDLARPMLEHAQRKGERQGLAASWVEADARYFDLGQRFQFIFITGNAFQAFLRREDQEGLLASVKRHLAPGGTFAFDTRNPTGHDLRSRDDEEIWFSYRNAVGQLVQVSGSQAYEPLSQVLHWTSYRRMLEEPDRPPKITRIACRFSYPQELAALLHYNGFVISAQYGGWDRRPLAGDSYSIISLCQHK